jgi:hypothetical protein
VNEPFELADAPQEQCVARRSASKREEAYELCVPDGLFGDPRIDALVATLQSTSYRALIADVPGCVSREAGTVRRVA